MYFNISIFQYFFIAVVIADFVAAAVAAAFTSKPYPSIFRSPKNVFKPTNVDDGIKRSPVGFTMKFV